MVNKKSKSEKAVPSDNWERSPLEKVERNYNVINEGILTKKDFALLFASGEEKYYIPAETTKRLDIYNNVTLSGGFLTYVAQQGIDVAIYDRFGNPLGVYSACQNHGNVETMIKQVNLYQDQSRRLEIAKIIELAAFTNMRKTVAYHLRCTDSKEIREIGQELKSTCSQIQHCMDMEHLMLVEAQGRQSYYRLFDCAISDESFVFGKRSKRPPENEINAMISFGNTLLYNRLALEISKTSLDGRIGVIHSTTARRNQTLNLDLAEIFKPLLVDSVIFRLVNNHILSRSWDFVPERGGIYLNESGKTKFIEAFNSGLVRKVTVDDKKLTYAQILRREVRNYRSLILHETPYRPYS